MLDFDAALTTACPPPDRAAAAAFAARAFGVTGRAELLSGERDANFRLISGDGQDHLLKIANPAEDRAVIEMQIAALRHLAIGDPDLPVQRVRAARDQVDIAMFESAGSPPRLAWMVSYLPGHMLASVPASTALRRQVGDRLARVTLGLADFSVPAADRALLWDLRQAGRLSGLLSYVRDEAMRDRLAAIFARFQDSIAPRMRDLPSAIVHADFNSHNLLVDDAGCEIVGILDFGDMLRTARVADLAVAASYHVGEDGDALAPVRDVVAGYEARISLTSEEQDLLPDLILTRLAMTVTISEWRAALYPENSDYILRNNARARLRLKALEVRDHG
ncbi:phosphotransferase [Govanella unica]|uniref:Hydroxylysine kinase n=1 Tax=Govanella unica TaxID=2975056 RepID=A0A9X3TVC6_9PROT|nr:phosphotransferase [Govania unica]MDA5192696.1 phosphotransferase [Govania unica]